MAEAHTGLMELLKTPREVGEFSPYAYYGAEEDALSFYFRPDAEYARRLSSRVTAFFSMESNELVGCQIKSIRHVLDDIQWFDVSIKHGKARIDLLFIACHGDFADEPARTIFRALGAEASRLKLEVDIPQSV